MTQRATELSLSAKEADRSPPGMPALSQGFAAVVKQRLLLLHSTFVILQPVHKLTAKGLALHNKL